MSEAPPQKTEEKDEKAPWNTKLADIIIKVLAGGSIGTFATLLSSSDLPKLALGAFFGGVVAPIVFAITEPISKKCASQKPFKEYSRCPGGKAGSNLVQTRIEKSRF